MVCCVELALSCHYLFTDMIRIYGGGYTLGSKISSGNPAGLIAASMYNSTSGTNGTNSTEGIIFVAMNYRLGALGWLSGPSFQGEGGVSNAALYDQRLAIQWVRQNIQLFGGDPNRITLMGESAGGGSIMVSNTLLLAVMEFVLTSSSTR